MRAGFWSISEHKRVKKKRLFHTRYNALYYRCSSLDSKNQNLKIIKYNIHILTTHHSHYKRPSFACMVIVYEFPDPHHKCKLCGLFIQFGYSICNVFLLSTPRRERHLFYLQQNITNDDEKDFTMGNVDFSPRALWFKKVLFFIFHSISRDCYSKSHAISKIFSPSRHVSISIMQAMKIYIYYNYDSKKRTLFIILNHFENLQIQIQIFTIDLYFYSKVK